MEYLSNVGRTFRFYLDKYSNIMTSEEIILHSLFESGVSRIAALDKYISDDIRRHGNRLSELEKKITNVYQEFTATEALDDDALFANEDDEEEESAFVMGQFTDDIGEDFLGLRELGIAAELGLPSLSVPKRLLKGKRNAKGPNATAKSAEPPPPYPPPQPLVSLTSETVKSQIGLLRGYFEHRLAGLDSLPDDPQNLAQAKLGPLGQVIRPSSAAIAAAAGGSKKKTKPKDGAATAAASIAAAAGVVASPATGAVTAGTIVAGVSVGVMSGVVASVMQPATPVLGSAGLLSPLGVSVAPSASGMVATSIPTGEPQPQAQTPKKKKATTGAGTGAAGGAGTGGGGGTGKKRGRPPEGLPPVVVASA